MKVNGISNTHKKFEGLTVKCVEEKNFKRFFKLLFTNVWEILLFTAN